MAETVELDAGAARPWSVFAVLAAGTVTGIAGIEMILPIVPSLPAALSGTPEQAQLAVASYIAGGALGTATFGELGARFDSRRVLAIALLAYAVLAFASAASHDLLVLALVRLLEGAAGAATIVFSPGMIRAAFPGACGVQAMGRLGTVAAVVALAAPPLGQLLGEAFGWRTVVIAPGLSAVVAGLMVMVFGQGLPRFKPTGVGGLGRLLRRPGVLALAINQALAQGALLTFAFGLPVFLRDHRIGPVSDFVVVRVLGVAVYISTALVGWRVARRFGARPTMVAATVLSTCAACGLAVSLQSSEVMLPWLIVGWVAVNVGQGLREPVVQIRLVERSVGDPARAIAVTTMVGMAITAVLTAALGASASHNPVPLSACSALVWIVALGALVRA